MSERKRELPQLRDTWKAAGVTHGHAVVVATALEWELGSRHATVRQAQRLAAAALEVQMAIAVLAMGEGR